MTTNLCQSTLCFDVLRFSLSKLNQEMSKTKIELNRYEFVCSSIARNQITDAIMKHGFVIKQPSIFSWTQSWKLLRKFMCRKKGGVRDVQEAKVLLSCFFTTTTIFRFYPDEKQFGEGNWTLAIFHASKPTVEKIKFSRLRCWVYQGVN